MHPRVIARHLIVKLVVGPRREHCSVLSVAHCVGDLRPEGRQSHAEDRVKNFVQDQEVFHPPHTHSRVLIHRIVDRTASSNTTPIIYVAIPHATSPW